MQPHPVRHARPRLIALVQIVLAAAILMWPLLIAGRPTLYADTAGYWRQGRAAIVQGLGLDRAAPDPFDLMLGAQVVDHHVLRDPAIASSFIAARSPTYGVFLFVTQQLGSLWLTAALQALACAAVLYAIWRAAAPRAAVWTYGAMMGGLAAFTSLPFYASFAMPDAFAGLDLLIIAAFTLYWDRMTPRTRVGLGALLAVSLTFHTSHLLIALAMAPMAVFALWRLGAPRRAILVRSGALVGAIIVATLGGFAAKAGMERLSGAPAHSPPFLTARLLADGPGRTWLRHACAGATPYLLCRFKDRPLDNSDAILWWNYADQGVFMTSSLADRLALEAEQPRFVRDVIAADPGGVALAAGRDFVLQLTRFYVDDPLHDPCEMTRFWYWSQSTATVLVSDPGGCGRAHGLILPAAPLYGLHAMVLLLSAFGFWRLARGRPARATAATPGPDGLGDVDRLLAATGLTGAAIVANAAICGMLSGPFARYEARLIWLLPALAALGGCAQTVTSRWREPKIASSIEPSTEPQRRLRFTSPDLSDGPGRMVQPAGACLEPSRIAS